MSEFEIKPFGTIEEFKACVALQEETWGHGFSERVAPAILKVSQILGGVAAGAYRPDGALAGFVFGMTGVKDGEVVHWSDMLAVRRDIRDGGLGWQLKAYQRQVLLDRGIAKMYWTFDPLQSRNAHLNFSKLGIVVRDYVRDMYGNTDSPLHRGIGTDRLVALWLMDSERVRARMSGEGRGPGDAATAPYALILDADLEATLPRPGRPILDAEDPVVRVAVPADISGVMATSMELAVAWRRATRDALTHYLGRGYEIREFVRGTGVSHYVLFAESS